MIYANNTYRSTSKNKGGEDPIVSKADRAKAQAKLRKKMNYKQEDPIVSKADRAKAQAKRKARNEGRGYQQYAGGIIKEVDRIKKQQRQKDIRSGKIPPNRPGSASNYSESK